MAPTTFGAEYCLTDAITHHPNTTRGSATAERTTRPSRLVGLLDKISQKVYVSGAELCHSSRCFKFQLIMEHRIYCEFHGRLKNMIVQSLICEYEHKIERK